MASTPHNPDGSVLVAARGVRRGYGRRTVLDGVDVQLRRGELVALLGPNGAGKTTLLKVLAGLLRPRGGDVTVDAATTMGWVPQRGGVHGRLTVRENLRLFARLQRLPDETVTAAVDLAQLEPWINATADELSGGLRQRLNVAVGLLGNPDALLLDEPTTGVDLEHRTSLATMLRRRVEAGGGVLHTTHDIEDARHADRVIVLVDGRVAWDGDLAGVATLAPQVVLPTEFDTLTDPVERGLLRAWRGGN